MLLDKLYIYSKVVLDHLFIISTMMSVIQYLLEIPH